MSIANELSNMTIDTSRTTTTLDSSYNATNSTNTSPWPVTATLSMGLLLLILCLPAVASNLVNALFLYKKRPLSARHLALLGSNGKRAPQELLLLNLSLNDMLLSLVCFIIVGASTLQSSYQHGAALQSIIVTMLLEYVASTLLAMRSMLLMLTVIERAHSSRHSRQHGLLQEQQFFQRSVWIISIVNTGLSLIDGVVKYDTLGTRVRRFVVLDDDDHYNNNCIDSNSVRYTTYCFMYSPSVIWWNWITFALRYAVPTLLCIILGAFAIINYFRALRAAVRAVVISNKMSVARHLRATAVAAHITATSSALDEKRARVRRASLKLALFVCASVVFTTLLLLALVLVVSPQTTKTFAGCSPHSSLGAAATALPDFVLGEYYGGYGNTTSSISSNAIVDCRAIGIPNYILTSQSAADGSQLPWLLTFFTLLTTLIDPIAVSLSYSVAPLESNQQGVQITRAAQQQQQQQFPPPRQRAALNELFYRIYHIMLLPTLAWLHITLYEPTIRHIQVAARLACPSRVFKAQQALVRRRIGGGGGARRRADNDDDMKTGGPNLHSTEFQRHQQQQYQNMMHFMSHNNNQHNAQRTAPFFHVAVQQQQRLRVLNQATAAAAQQQQLPNNTAQKNKNSRHTILTIENYINVSQVQQLQPMTASSAVRRQSGKGHFSQKSQQIKMPPPQQMKLLMPNDVSDIGDIMRPGTSSAVPDVIPHNMRKGVRPVHNSTTSAVVVVEQMPQLSRSSTTAVNNKPKRGFRDPESMNMLRPSTGKIEEESSVAREREPKSTTTTSHHFVQHIWSTHDTAVQFVRLGGEVRLPAAAAAESSAADFHSTMHISRLPSLSESF